MFAQKFENILKHLRRKQKWISYWDTVYNCVCKFTVIYAHAAYIKCFLIIAVDRMF